MAPLLHLHLHHHHHHHHLHLRMLTRSSRPGRLFTSYTLKCAGCGVAGWRVQQAVGGAGHTEGTAGRGRACGWLGLGADSAPPRQAPPRAPRPKAEAAVSSVFW
ncbi:hypothetical protein E2C01_050425 [Portunus trituberculatus]|uniref:Uncharacterized protein n=1 Tax=Portunus trituberculatus TaxID=210409 RepID=A0A5B7GIX7_PORTR|nr:hypothetical protein [Portunus trituberculatus]